MKNILFILTICLLCIIYSCDNDEIDIQYESTGQIIGPNLADCTCCGNLITLNDNDQYFQFLELPENSTIDLQNAIFPLPVQLNWSIEEGTPCEFMIIEDIELL